MGEEQEGPYKYKAFISYARGDRKLAVELQRQLERYVLPGAFKLTGQPAARRRPLYPIFRDESELVPGENLPNRIRHGLEQSQFLIVVCSPIAAKSQWVEREIIEFCRLGRQRSILAVVAAGEPFAERHNLASELEALPKALRFGVSSDGSITDTEVEPLWIDRRAGSADPHLMFLRIVAALLGLDSFDELISRDRRAQRLRFRNFAIGSALVSLVLATLLALSALFLLNSEATRNAALIAQSRYLSRDAQAALEVGNYKLGLLLSLEAAPKNLARPDRPVTVQALVSLAQAWIANPHCRLITSDEKSDSLTLWSSNGRLAITGHRRRYGSNVRIWDVSAWRPVQMFHDIAGALYAISPDGKRFATVTEDLVTLRKLGIATEADVSKKRDVTGYAVAIRDISTAKILTVLRGHTKTVSAVAFSPDGKRIVSAGSDGTIRVWDIESGKQLLVFTEERETIEDIEIAPDGSTILSLEGNNAHLWNAISGKMIAALRADLSPMEPWAKYSPDSTRIVTVSQSSGISAIVWDAKTGKKLLTVREPDHTTISDYYTNSARFSHDGRYIVTSSSDRTARVWDAVSGEEVVTLRGHQATVVDASFSPDDKFILTISEDNTARYWRVANGTVVNVIQGYLDSTSSGRFSANGNRLLLSSGDGSLLRCEIPEDVRHFYSSGINSAVWDYEGRRLLVAGMSAVGVGQGRLLSTAANSGVSILDAKTLATIRTFPVRKASDYSAKFSSDGRLALILARVGLSSKTHRYWSVWDVSSGMQLMEYDLGAGFADDSKPSPNGQHLLARQIVTSADGKTEYDYGPALIGLNRQIEFRIACGFFNVEGHYSPDSTKLVTVASTWAGTKEEYVTCLYDIPRHRLMAILGHYKPWAVTFSPTSSILAASPPVDFRAKSDTTRYKDHSVRLWDVKTGRFLRSLDGHRSAVWAVTFSNDEKRILTASQDGSVRIWDTATGSLLMTLTHQFPVRNAAFSPDNKRVLTWSASDSGANTISLWDAGSGTKIADLTHQYWGLPSFMPDGRTIFAASEGLPVGLWDGRTGVEIGHIPSPRLANVDASPDGRRLMITTYDAPPRIWTLPPRCQDLIDADREIAQNAQVEMTDQQRTANFLSAPDDSVISRAYRRARPLFDWVLPHPKNDCLAY